MRRLLVLTAAVSLSSCVDLASRWDSASSGVGQVVRADGTEPIAPAPDVQPLMGGSLLVTSDDNVLVTDPNRDSVFFVTMLSARVERLQLPRGSVPARALELGPGHFLVLLRAPGKVATVRHDVALRLGEVFDVCAEPRGIARVPGGVGQAMIACGSGELVTVDATRVLARQFIEPDLRDVVFLDGAPWVTTFRSPRLISVPTGVALRPRDVTLPSFFAQQPRSFSPTVAWRTVAAGPNTAVMVHQRAATSSIALGATAGVDGGGPNGGPGGAAYGGGGNSMLPCVTGDNVVHTVVTRLTTTGEVVDLPLPSSTLPVDLAVSPDGATFAIAAAGSGAAVEFPVVTTQVPPTPDGCVPMPSPNVLQLGQVTGVGYLSTNALVAHSMNMDVVFEQRRSGIQRRIPLVEGEMPAFNAGQAIFHNEMPAGLACASCHPEARDDGHTFVFDDQPVRTQSLAGGLLATAPFHWKGEHRDMAALLGDTMVRRMGAPMPGPLDVQLLDGWLDARPLPAPVATRQVTAAGRAAFERAGCASCHAGARMTNNTSVDVGTGGRFQVPSLLGLSRRGPWMHDGCAATLRQRFSTSCGGTAHGDVSVLSTGELDELVAYLEAL